MTTTLWKFTRLACTLALGALPAALPAFPAAAAAQDPAPADDPAYQGESSDRYAQVKRVEGDVRIRKGEVEEALDRGVPVAEGDTIVSRGRGVLQLGDGTRVAFGSGATLQVGALFTDAKGGRQVMLRLDQGRIRLALGGRSEARFRVDTPSGTAAMAERGEATVAVEGDRSVRVRVHTGHLTFTTDQDQARLAAGERLTVYSRADRLDRVGTFNTYQADPFDQWCERNLEFRRGESWDRVPGEIRYYADDLDGHGDWVEVPDAGWCWRPRVSVLDWRPFWRGRWGAYGGGMTWVSDEPWGFVTHHYGRWGWDAGFGWYWIPGLYYSPAWVAWTWGAGYCGWAPLNYWNRPCAWGHGAWAGGHAWNVVHASHINARGLHGHIRADRGIIASFSGGTGATSWNPAWRRAPVFVTPGEFRNPAQIGRAFDRQVARERMGAYERSAQAATGRTVLRRDPAAGPEGRGHGLPFEDRSRARIPDRPGPERGPAADPGRRPDAAPPRERARDERGRDFFGEERRRGERPAPAERHRLDAPRVEPPSRQDPGRGRPSEAPRERPHSERPSAPAPSNPGRPSGPAPGHGPERGGGSPRRS